MNRTKALLLLVIVIAVVGTVAGLVTVSARSSEQPLAAQKVKVVGDDGRVTEISPIVAERNGKARVLESSGKSTLEELGYAGLSLPCKGKFEAISLSYVLPNDAAQGPDNWYVLNCEMDVELSEASDNGTVEISAITNSAPCHKLSFQTERENDLSVACWMDSGVEHKATPSDVAHVSFSAYLRDADMAYAGVKPGENVLTFRLAQYGGGRVRALRVSGDTSVEITTVPPSGYTDVFPADLPRLSAEDEAKSNRIVMSDPMVQQLLQDRPYEIKYVGPCEWPAGSGNARLDLVFKIAQQIQCDWPWPPAPVREKPMSGNLWVRTMTIAIDLDKEAVTGISPCGQPIASQSKVPPGPQPPTLSDEEKAKAKQIVLDDLKVRGMLAGKSYAVARGFDETRSDTRIGVWQTEDLKKLGAVVEICFDRPSVVEIADSKYMVQVVVVFVDLTQGKVADIVPLGKQGE